MPLGNMSPASAGSLEPKKTSSAWPAWRHLYPDLVFRHPLAVLLASLTLFLVLPVLALCLRPLRLDSNPEKGFDTRGTDYALARLGWAKLQPFLLQGSRVVVDVEPKPELNKRAKRGWADDLLLSLGSVACYEHPIPAMDYLAQTIVSVPSFDALFTPPLLTDLCHLHEQLRPVLKPFDMITPHRNIWHLANYVACLSPESRINCTYVKTDDISAVKELVQFCNKFRAEIVECRRECLERVRRNQLEQQPLAPVECKECKTENVPANCSNQMMFDLFYRILPMDLAQRPLHLNAFLPVYTYTSYQLQGYPVRLGDFVNIQSALTHLNSSTFRVEGTLLDVKRDLLLESALNDSRFSLLAGVLVVGLVIVYTRSLTYCLACLVQLVASVMAAAAVYRLFSAEFPLLNMIVFVLLISIGSDGAFLLHSAFPDSSLQLDRQSFRKCIQHTASTMFLSQFSTVVPFFLNMFSAVLAFRAFGLFAGFTLIFNYFLLISFMPAVLILQRRHIDPWAREMIKPCASVLYRIEDAIEDCNHYVLGRLLPALCIRGRYLWLLLLTGLTVFCAHKSLTGLHLPQYNPLQLFVGSDPNEFYDNNAERLFEFVGQKIALPLSIRLVWGVRVRDLSDYFDSRERSTISADPDFRLDTVEQMQSLAAYLGRVRNLNFVRHEAKFWPERFLDWSKRIPCDSDALCCNVASPLYSDSYLDHCMRLSTSQLLTNYNDTPIYHNYTFEFVGYTALLPLRLKYSHKFGNLSEAFDLLDQNMAGRSGMWYTTEWGLMSTWYDLQRSIINDSKQSVLISLAVVLVFASSILKFHAICAMLSIVCIVTCVSGALVLMGWEVGMLESVILVLAVSLSFDYTLHYGAALPSARALCPRHRIAVAIRRSTQPVCMAALSSALAGLAMLGSSTHAFFQVAVFLLVSTGFSFLFATFFFLPLVYLFLEGKAPEQCDSCRIDLALQLNEAFYTHRIAS